MQGFLDPVGDPLQSPVYLAEGDIIGMSPQHDLPDLAAVAKYVDDIASAHNINLMGCYRGWYFQDGPSIVYDPSEAGADMNGIDYPRADGSTVRLYNPPGRAGHFYKDPPEGPVVVFAAPSTGPISHKLLVLHELAHALTATTEADHGRGWISAWLGLVDEHLPDRGPWIARRIGRPARHSRHRVGASERASRRPRAADGPPRSSNQGRPMQAPVGQRRSHGSGRTRR